MKLKNLIAPFIISFLLAATTSLAAESLVLSDKSYGLVTFGGKLKAIEKKLGEKTKGETGDKGCDFVTFKKYPEIKFMVEEGIVTRADALSPHIQNTPNQNRNFTGRSKATISGCRSQAS